MLTELVTLCTADEVELDGALYRTPAGAPPRAAVLMLHGLTWNFYRGPSRWLPALLAAAGFDCLSMNMRDHDLTEPKDFERSHHDIRACLAWLRARSRAPVVALAHGYACNKLVCYPSLSGDHELRYYVLTTLGGVQRYRPDIWDQVLRAAPALEGEMLIVQGAVDPNIDVASRAEEVRAAGAGVRTQTVMIEGGNHYFDARHEALSRAVTGWLADVL